MSVLDGQLTCKENGNQHTRTLNTIDILVFPWSLIISFMPDYKSPQIQHKGIISDAHLTECYYPFTHFLSEPGLIEFEKNNCLFLWHEAPIQ